MKKNSTRVLCLIIALLLGLASISGCSSKNAGDNPSTSAGPTQAAASSGGAVNGREELAAMEPIEFTVFRPDPSMKIPPENAPILQQVYDKTKVKIKFDIPPADAIEYLNIKLAASDYPDIIEFPNYDTMGKYINAGHLIPLDGLLDKYGTVLKTNLGPILNRLRSEADGKIYYLPGRYRINGVDQFPETGNNFNIRSDFLEKKGWYKPQTLEDYENLLKEIKAQDPKIIPVSFALGGGSGGDISTLTRIAVSASGLAYSGGSGEFVNLIKQDDDTLGFAYKNESVRDFYKWLNKLHIEGLLDKEAPVLTMDALKTKSAAGKVASVIGDFWSAPAEANNYFESKNMNQLFYYFFLKANQNVQKVTYAAYSLAYNYGYGITDKCKDPERLIKFINYLNTEDGFNAMHGITNFDGEDKEGYDFYVDKNQGNAIFPTKWFSDQIAKDENFGASRGFMTLLGFGFAMSNVPGGKYDYIKVEEDVGAWDSDTMKKVKAGFGVKGTDYFPMMRDMSIDVTEITGFPLQPESDEGIIKAKIDDYIFKTVPKLIVAESEADFNLAYDDFLAKLDKMGLEKWITKMNELYKARKELWK